VTGPNIYFSCFNDALEENKWKNIEGRVSLRPLGPLFPNIQVSYFFIWGKGNTRKEPVNPGEPTFAYPAWKENIFMVSFEHRYQSRGLHCRHHRGPIRWQLRGVG
jgi:hypothetical protein